MNQVIHFSILGLAILSISCATGRDEYSGPDGQRINATALESDTISDDKVDLDEGDATDWRFVEVGQVGKLEINLHWDNQQAQMSLGLYDGLGKRLADSQVDGQKGRKILFDVEKQGRYYVKVEAEKEGTPYSLKASFVRGIPKRCHNCTAGQKVCITKEAVAVCNQTNEGCNAFTEIMSCDPDQTCRDGQCVAGCEDQCKPDERRCASWKKTQVCTRAKNGCMQWSVPSSCGKDMVCSRGKCKKGKKRKPPPKAAPKELYVKGKIISMYTKDGKRTLHIEIGENTGVAPGMSGEVLEGSSNNPVSNGGFKVIKASGRFAIAVTALEAIGNNRKVRIKLR